ncbi:hypothetical protein ACJX0J_012386, partial [Zea mays]
LQAQEIHDTLVAEEEGIEQSRSSQGNLPHEPSSLNQVQALPSYHLFAYKAVEGSTLTGWGFLRF